ncbi:MAG: DnaJ domain-containing protein [Gudongella sp.]|nr:DnaJ domain-containing protein [Gudongella sp.]
MTLMKKAAGRVIYGTGQALSFIFDLFIGIAEVTVSLVIGIARGFAALIGMGGCLILFLLFGPFGLVALLNPITILVILFFIIFPILGQKFISFLKYWRYIVTEYLYDLGSYLMDGKGEHKSFAEYGHKYQKMEEERIRRERERRQQQQQQEWEERFRQWQSYQRQGGQQWQGQGGYTGQQTYANPMTEFKQKYRKSCDVLDLPYDTDKYQVKLAYRKKAKEYHPDINRAPDATSKFQEINDAYEFLSDENIDRYKGMS